MRTSSRDSNQEEKGGNHVTETDVKAPEYWGGAEQPLEIRELSSNI